MRVIGSSWTLLASQCWRATFWLVWTFDPAIELQQVVLRNVQILSDWDVSNKEVTRAECKENSENLHFGFRNRMILLLELFSNWRQILPNRWLIPYQINWRVCFWVFDYVWVPVGCSIFSVFLTCTHPTKYWPNDPKSCVEAVSLWNKLKKKKKNFVATLSWAVPPTHTSLFACDT